MWHVKQPEIATMAISPDERAFFIQLGTRIADLRKAQNITQVQMAETLSVSQQTINSYEVARRRVPVSTLPTLSKLLGVSLDELLGEQNSKTPSKRGPSSKLQSQIEQISLLPKSKQKFITDMLDALIKQK